jgi:hypothetical protein
LLYGVARAHRLSVVPPPPAAIDDL